MIDKTQFCTKYASADIPVKAGNVSLNSEIKTIHQTVWISNSSLVLMNKIRHKIEMIVLLNLFMH